MRTEERNRVKKGNKNQRKRENGMRNLKGGGGHVHKGI